MTSSLQTDRLILRPWRDEDIEAWVDLCADERVMEFFPSTVERSESVRTALRLRERLDRDGYGWWVVQRRSDPKFIGAIALQEVPFEAAFTPALEIGWRMSVAAWGKGYATEGARAALQFAFEQLEWDEVVAMTSTLNGRSRRVMERLGVTRDPRDDFENPRIDPGHPLRPHVLYRTSRSARANGAVRDASG